MHNQKVKRMTVTALLIALIVVLQLLGYVLPRLGPFGLSFVLIPLVIGAAYLGPGGGAILGGAFGVIVCICSYNGMDMGGQMVWQASPLLCILVVMTKGIAAGAGAGAVYRWLAPKNSYVAMVFAAGICPVLNTGLFLIGMRLFFFDILDAWAGGSNILGYVLTGIVVANFVPEFVINLAFSPAGQRILSIVKR